MSTTQLFFHSDPQRNALMALLRDVMQKSNAINFKNPAEDEENIRYHAYLKGKQELLISLLEDKFEVEQPANATNGVNHES